MTPLPPPPWSLPGPGQLVQALMDAYPDGVSVTDKNARLPLHLAARNAERGEVVALLVDAFVEGAASQDKDGALPLHDAALTGAAVEVCAYTRRPNEHCCSYRAIQSGKGGMFSTPVV